MAFKATGIRDVVKNVQNFAKSTNRQSRRVMDRYAEKMEKLARDNAPVDTGNLEEAIEGHTRTRIGRRKTITVEINDFRHDDGTPANDYGALLHETRDWKLGPKSQAKAAGGKQVGSKFIERAVDELLPDLVKDIEDTLK